MSTDPAALPAPARPASTGRSVRVHATALSWVEREWSTLLLLAAYLCAALSLLPDELVQDSWLTLVSGREVVENGLPRVDTLTSWTLGREWIDQQWLAQAGAYRLWLLGGIELVGLVHVAVLTLSLAGAIVAARLLGGSRGNVALVAAGTMIVAPWALQLRAQTLAMPLFVAVLWLLAADSRAPSRRVFLVVPLLVLWANLHGTVVLAALFVALRGVTVAVAALRRGEPPRRWLAKAASLVLLPFACLFASPYGIELVGYYQSLFLNPMLRRFIGEWGASTPSALTALFYVLAFLTVWLLARNRARLTGFEAAALLAATAGGVLAIRSIVWFGLTALLLLPRLLDGELPARERAPARGRPHLVLGLASVAALVGAVAITAAKPGSWYVQRWEADGARRVAELAAAPGTKVFSDDRNADWLLWQHPQLAGRIAQDVRFELFEPEQFHELDRIRKVSGDWRGKLKSYDVLALDPLREQDLIEAARSSGDFVPVWRGKRLTVLARS